MAIANETNTNVTVTDAYNWIIKHARCRPMSIIYHLVLVLFIKMVRSLKDEDFTHIISSFMFSTVPGFIREVLKELSRGERGDIQGPAKHYP